MNAKIRIYLLFLCCTPTTAALAQDEVPNATPVPNEVVVATPTLGEAGVVPRSLADQARAAKGSFVAPTADDVAVAKAELDTKMTKLIQMLQRGSNENLESWKSYLRWDELQAELAKDKLNTAKLRSMTLRFKRNENGLEMYEFRGVRQALETYIDAVRYTSRPAEQLSEIFDSRVEGLAKTLERYEKKPSMDDAADIGFYLRFLEQGRLAPKLLAAIRARFNRPNTYSRVSERLFAAGINQPVNQSAPVSDVILGTRIVGAQSTTGNAVANFIPSYDSAKYQVVMNGTAHSQTNGFNRQFKIKSVGKTTIHVVKPFELSMWGMTASPATANTRTCTTITGVSGARLRMVNNIASRRANQQKPQAEAIANERAQVRAARQVDTQSIELVSEANANYRQRVIAPLLRLDYFPQQLRYTTTNDFLFAISTLASESQVAAPDRPQSVVSDDDLMVHIHESMISNYAELRFAGATISSENLDEFRQENSDIIPKGLDVSQGMKANDDVDPWEITLVTRRPYRVYFDDNRVKIAIRGSRFKRGDTVLPSTAELEIAAEYTMQFGANGAKLVRDGAVSTRFFTRKSGELEEMKKLAARFTTYKTFIVEAFESMFRDEIEIKDIVLQGRWSKAGSLRLYTYDATNGWITLGWKLSQPGRYQADYYETVDRNHF